ncbi:AAA family ATPase [Paraliomyxa miuraensis]|uniref:AAA family ATPase n=1 Tax=Paraliomyxa miuraensis TaxID=376150 RepID=UPI00225BB35C|nr:AAA family ATPase [Paraliomyxa miuraensis]MCX4241409.1 AAA family ATPase [Paraliomyxa miuraensis]
MELTFTVFQRRRGRHYEWFPLGLGRLGRAWQGANLAKIESSLTEALRKSLTDAMPAVLEPLEMIPGRRLELVDLSLSLSSRGRLHGKFPLVVEPRPGGPAADGEPLRCVYHPLRSTEWFPWPEGESLAERATAYLRTQWSELGEDELEDLRAHKNDRLRVVSMSVTTKNLRNQLDDDDDKKRKEGGSLVGGGPRLRGSALLAQLAVDETRRAIDGRLPCGMPRRPLRDRLAQLVAGKRRVSVLLVGPSGSGKSMLVRQLVHDLLQVDDYPSHRNYDRLHPVFRLAGRRIIAGMSYLGQWEQRCVDVVEAGRKVGAVLWIEDLHAWGRLGETQQSDRSLASFFRGPVARGELAMVGEVTPEQYQQLQDDAPALAAAFTTLFVEPSDRAETMRMLVHESRALELRHRVSFDPAALRTIYELGHALGSGSAQPGRAIELLRSMAAADDVGSLDLRQVEAAVRRGRKIDAIKLYRSICGEGLKDSKDAVEQFMSAGHWPLRGLAAEPPPLRIRSERATDFGHRPRTSEIDPATVIRRLARRTGMPEVLLSPQRSLSSVHLREQLAAQIMGQPAAVDAMTALVLRIKAGLTDASRPWGVLLFTGPTGTGKTEMAKCLAEYLYGSTARLLRFDMGEFADPYAPARLIGDRARPEGALTSRVRVLPFCVVLLDEIEKAHPSVLNLMLQLFDDGRLTDAAGTLVDFTHTVVVMTSNLGARAIPPAGFGGRIHGSASEVEAAVREFFPPELFNRIDRVVPFEPLERAAATQIARRELDRLLTRRGLTERNVFVRFTDSVVRGVVDEAFDARYGARSLKRWLEDHIGAWLADEIAGQPSAGLRVLWLHRGPEGLRLHAELLTEAEAWGEPGPFEALLSWNASRLRTQVPGALQRLERLLESPRVEALARALRQRLAASVHGDADAADAVFNLEGLRSELTGLRERLRTQAEYDPLLLARSELEERADHEGELIEAGRFGRLRIGGDRWTGDIMVRVLSPNPLGPSLPMQRRPDFVGALADLYFMELALEHAHEPEYHAVLLELSRVNRPEQSNRFLEAGPGLVEQLARAYVEHGRGEPDAWEADGGTTSTLDEALARANERLVIRLVGPAVRASFEGEHGSHVRHGLGGGSEVVRVRVLDGSITPAEHVRRLETEREAFVAGLESGAVPLPDNPDAVLPIVRRYRFDPPRPGEPTSIEIEDYPLAHAVQTRARGLADVLPSLWLLRVGRRSAGLPRASSPAEQEGVES